MEDYHDLNETSSLLTSSGKGKKRRMSGRSSAATVPTLDTVRRELLAHRVGLLGLLAVITALALFGQNEVQDLRLALQEQQAQVDQLQTLLNIHEEVIERFNSSVTNHDVLGRLTRLEDHLNTTQRHLEHELMQAQKTMSEEMNRTLQELSQAVDAAETEISQEVDKVKKDVEQYVVTTQDQFSMENSFMVYQLAGTFALLSCLISMWHMTAHLRRMNQPQVQRKILAILWMSPVYAVTSWFSLVFHSAEGYLAIIKDFYEAYVIYQFLSFCIAVLGRGDRNAVVDLLAQHAEHLTPPFRLFGFLEICGCCKPEPFESSRALADAILLQCQFFAMQFVFFRPMTTTAMVVLGKLQYYGAGKGPGDYLSPQFYITLIQNVSIFVAFTGLLKFYHAVDKELAWCRPFAKFLCIKGVVFMTFWQGLAISVLAATTNVGQDGDPSEWAKSAQNFLICLEMLLFSIAHFYCFPTEEWEEGYRVKHSGGQFGDSIALGDFFQDVKLILKLNEKKKRKKLSKEPAIPEGDEEDEGEEDPDDNNHKSSSGLEKDVVKATTDEEIGAIDVGYETEGVSSSTTARTDDLVDEEKMVAQALEESLGLAGDDPDIIEAKKRLLASKVLRPEFFDVDYMDESTSDRWDEEEDDDEEDPDEDEFHDADVIHLLSATESDGPMGKGGILSTNSSTCALSPSEVVYTPPAKVGGCDEQAHERSNLLLTPEKMQGAELLRPSIFTTVASLAQSTGVDEESSGSRTSDALNKNV